MNEKKLNQLFAAARQDAAPTPPTDFAADVLRAVRREPARTPWSVFDQLNLLFPRLALAAAAVIVLSVATDWTLTATGLPDIGDSAAQTTSSFPLEAEEL